MSRRCGNVFVVGVAVWVVVFYYLIFTYSRSSSKDNPSGARGYGIAGGYGIARRGYGIAGRAARGYGIAEGARGYGIAGGAGGRGGGYGIAGGAGGGHGIAGGAGGTGGYGIADAAPRGELIDAATALSKEHGVVLFTIVNDAFYQMVSSWLCNTATMPGLHSKVLFLSTDIATGQRLKRRWPAVNVVSFDSTDFSGGLKYSTAGYVKLMVERTRIIQHLVQAQVRLLLFEVDFTWLADPLPVVLSQPAADVVAIEVYGTGKKKVCGCFLLLNPTQPTREVWNKLTKQMDDLFTKVINKAPGADVSEATNDQTFLSALLREKFAGVNRIYLPAEEFPGGKWYMEKELRDWNPAPLIIHNNWIVGTDKKIQRAKSFGHWFLASDDKTDKAMCDTSAVQKVLELRAKAHPPAPAPRRLL